MAVINVSLTRSKALVITATNVKTSTFVRNVTLEGATIMKWKK
jgi:hypothetical protein